MINLLIIIVSKIKAKIVVVSKFCQCIDQKVFLIECNRDIII